MRSMVVAGVMSGTSADGVDVALCRIGGALDRKPKVEVLGYRGFRYPPEVREAVLQVMAGAAVGAAEMSRLGWRLGGIYADAVESACEEIGVGVLGGHGRAHLSRGEAAAKMGHPVEIGVGVLGGHGQAHLRRGEAAAKMVHPVSADGGIDGRPVLELVGCHGQTVHHEAAAVAYLGAEVRSTWQIGEAAVVAERMRCPVVSDFRPADLAAGGQGAPLVPMLDAVMFRSARVGRVLANVGGIANVTALPAGRGVEGVMAFDTGPGNMVIDHCMRRLYGREFDEDGGIARGGTVYAGEVTRAMRSGFFAARPPKSCGREEFGERFGDRFLEACRKAGAGDADVVATATALTSTSMVEAYEGFVADRVMGGKKNVEYVVAGGGARNLALMGMLEVAFAERGVTVKPMDALGVAAEAKEAVAFALLAWLTWQRRVGNVPGATGATRAAVLGKVCFG